MLKIYDKFNKKYFLTKSHDIKLGSRIENNQNSYVIDYIKRSRNEIIEVAAMPEDEYKKKVTIVNLKFTYVTLKEVEEVLENYGFRLEMIKE